MLGDIKPQVLGNTDAHEHLLMCSSHLRGEELDDPELSCIEATRVTGPPVFWTGYTG